MSLRLGIIGAGKMARFHAAAFQAIPGAEVSAIHSRTLESAEKFAAEFQVEYIHATLGELIAAQTCDALLICVSPTAMCEISLRAMESGLPLLLEKPPGLDLNEAQQLAAAAQKTGSRAWVALNRRFFASTLRVQEAIAAAIGRRYVHVVDQQNLADSAKRGHSEETLANWMYANSLHLVDLLKLFCRGEVMAIHPLVPWRSDFHQLAVFGVEFSSGDYGVFEANWSGPGPWSVAVTCPDQRWELRPLETARWWGQLRAAPTEFPLSEDDAKYKPGLLEQARAFVAAVQGNPTTLPTLADGLASMQLVHDLFRI